MKFGLGLPTGMEGLINPVPFFRPDDFVRAGRTAEQLGYDSVWGNDHYAPQDYVREKYRQPPSFYEVLSVLTAVGATTSRIELGTAVLVLPIREVPHVARQVATVDQLTGGRMLLGVGIGAYREEYQAFRPDLVGRNRGTILEEGLELLNRLYSEDDVSADGATYRVQELSLHPKPHRLPFPLLVGGHQQRAIDRAVALGSGWIPGWRPFGELRDWIGILRERAAEAGRDPSSLIAAPQLSCLIGRTHEEAERAYMQSGMVAHRVSLAKTGRDPNLAMDNNLVGSAEEVLEKVEFLHDAGADHLACITLCVDTVEEYFEQAQILAEQVIAPYRKAHGLPDPAEQAVSPAS